MATLPAPIPEPKNGAPDQDAGRSLQALAQALKALRASCRRNKGLMQEGCKQVSCTPSPAAQTGTCLVHGQGPRGSAGVDTVHGASGCDDLPEA